MKIWVLFSFFPILTDRFIQQKLGGPSASEYEKLQAEVSDLQLKYNELLAAHQETCREVNFSLGICQCFAFNINQSSAFASNLCLLSLVGIFRINADAVNGIKLNLV